VNGCYPSEGRQKVSIAHASEGLPAMSSQATAGEWQMACFDTREKWIGGKCNDPAMD
jgi:hypothetical protein